MSQSAVTSMALTFEIFRSGTHTPMVGSAASFSEADLDSIVRAYDPALHEAPIVIGHPKDNGPAFGWVKGLAREGDRLKASVDPQTLHLGFAEAVKSGAYKKRSASFYRPDSPNNPKPGTYYLRHVGFLGAQPPAVKGLADVAFAGTSDECIEFPLDFAELDFALLLRSLRDWLIGKFGVEEADKALPPWDVNNTQAAGVLEAAQGDPMSMKTPSFAENQPPAAGAAPATAPKAPDLEKLWAVISTFLPADMPEPDKAAKKKLVEDALKGEAPAATPPAPTAEHAERQRQLDARERELAAKEAKIRADEHASFLESHVRSGKPLPDTREATLALMTYLGGDTEVSFGENDKRSPLEVFRKMLGNMRAEIDFAERSGGAGEEIDFNERELENVIAKEALAFQEAEQKKGNVITTAEAVRHVKKEKAAK